MLIIPQNVVQAIHDYLITRPMREVEGLVMELRKAKPLPQAKEVTPDLSGIGPTKGE